MLTNIERAMKFGYWFVPPKTEHAPGGNRLVIALHEASTPQEYAIWHVNLPVKTGEHSLESLKIRHPWDFERAYPVCSGVVEMINNRGDKVEAFTFGGHLQIDRQQDFTVCTLESPAPILDITQARPTERLLIDEINILLAERRAERLSEPHSYEERLVNADPFELYVALIFALSERMEHSHHKEYAQTMHLLNFIHDERKRLEAESQSPLIVTPLNKIL